ncbi:putative disease resistance protein [Senna tora]|uniref:Putative disease resistance protein n=1 Tax=Senna tora TaxID=362788 RepID=A0A834TV46_9FABA|nr:putative disease resistance protein [Senna tora]
MASLVGGAAIGAGFQQALTWGLEIINMGLNYSSTLQTNIDTLEALGPVVQDIVWYNQELDRPREEVEPLIREMRAGEELIRRYSNVSRRNFLCFPCYQKKLLAVDESLRRTLSVNVQVQMARDVKEILKKVTDSLMILSQQFGHINYGMGTALYGAPENPEFTVGLEMLLEQLKIEVLKDGLSFLNLTGFGGSGKTTLAKKLCWEPQVLGKFNRNNIFFATFSKSPNLKIIVERLFEHFEQPKPEFQSNEDPGYKLRILLNQVGATHPILLVLDDVWPGSESLVEKFKVQISNLKILVTSRVALNLESRITFQLDPLSLENSVTLFRHFAQLEDTTSCPPNDLVHKVVKCCRGLPLALQLIGGKLRRKPIEFWQKMVKELSQGHSIIHSDNDVLAFLQKCLDVMEDKSTVQECFMDLGLFPEDQMIPVSALFDIWTELHKLDEEFYAMPYIYELTTKNLCNVVVTRKLGSDADNYYNNHFLTQHDILRDLAIHQSNKKPFEQRKNLIIDITGDNHPGLWSEPKQQGIIARVFLKGIIKQKQQHVAARSLSISSGSNSKWWSMKPDKAEVLVLNLWSNNYILPGFIKSMKKLKVLILTNYSFHPSQLDSFELLGSLSNLKRIRLQRVCVPSLCKLKNLRKLSLYMCYTSQAFGGGTINIKDALPNLVDMSIDYCNDLVALPTGFCEITTLEKLSITNCHKFSALPQDIGNMENLRVLRLNSCTDLLDIPDSIRGLQMLSLLDISYCISLGRLPKDIGELRNLSKLYMMGCSSLSEFPDCTKLEKLEKLICDEEIATLCKAYFDPTGSRSIIEVAKVDHDLTWLVGSSR